MVTFPDHDAKLILIYGITKLFRLKNVKGIDISANPLAGSRLCDLGLVVARECHGELLEELGTAYLLAVDDVVNTGK